MLDSVPVMVQAKDDVKAYNFYRKPIMKEKSQIQNHLMSNSLAYNQRERRAQMDYHRSAAAIQDIDSLVFGNRKIAQSID